MTTSSFDPVRYKADQRRSWGSVAAGWKRWWRTIERGAQPVSDRLVELAGLRPGQRVLDVATGIGEPAATAARAVGPAGRVTAVDQAPEMLAVARERAAELGLRNVEFLEMDAEGLDLSDLTFDAVLCRWGLMFLPDLPAALGRLGRHLIAGGRLATAVWGTPADVPMISLASGTVRELLQLPPPPPDVPTPFSLADVTLLERALTGTGFREIVSEPVTLVFEWPSAEDYARYQQAIAAPLTALLAEFPPEQQAHAWAAVTEAARRYAGPDGVVRMENQAICFAAHRAD